jgi:hypothetical protein
MPPREKPPSPGRLLAWAAIPVALAVFGALLLLIWGERRRGTQYVEDRFEISGEFLPDGTCVVRLDGAPVDTGVTPHTEHGNSTSVKMEPEGFDLYQIHCGSPLAEGDIVDRRNFWVWGVTRAGRPLVAGTYAIAEGAVDRGQPSQWEGMLFHPRFEAEGAHLEGYGGTLTLTQVDDVLVGSFRFVARRTKRSPFSLAPPPPREAPPA